MSNKDSAELEGTQGSQSEGSNNNAGQQGSEQEYVTIKQFNEMMGKIEGLSRTLQGDKDRAVKKTNQRLDGLESNLKAVLEKANLEGKSISDLLSQVEADEEKEFRQTMLEVAKSLKGGSANDVERGSAAGSGVNVAEVLKDLELDETDLRVKEFSTKKFMSKEEAYREGAKLVKTIISKQPTDADLPSGVVDRVKNASKQEQLMAEYKEGSKNLYGQALINYKMQMRKKGLTIF